MNSQFEEGMICFSGGNSFIQKCIKFFTNCNFSHSFVIVKGPSGILSAFETTSTICCLSSVCKKHGEKNYIECYRIKDEFARSLLIRYSGLAYLGYAGNWYGYLSYIWFMYRWLMRKFNIEKTKMWEWCSNGITCTELTMQSFPYPDLLPIKKDLNTFSPKELRDIVIKNPDKFEFTGWINREYFKN